MRPNRRWLGGLAACAVVGAVGLFAWDAPVVEAPTAGGATVSPQPTTAGWSLMALGGAEAPAQAGPATAERSRTAEALLHTLFTEGSLRGAELDGSWGPWESGRLNPSMALRRRFDQLLTTLGETTADELRQLVGWLADRDLGPAGAEAVLAVWDSYLQLQRHQYREVMDLQNPQRWADVLQERQRVRRDALGRDWAEAFYGEEERAFGQRMPGTPQPANATESVVWTDPAPAGMPEHDWHRQRQAALGPEAAQRLLDEERAQADWQARLAAARVAADRIARAPELSSIQRETAFAQLLEQHFQGNERLRASALLGL